MTLDVTRRKLLKTAAAAAAGAAALTTTGGLIRIARADATADLAALNALLAAEYNAIKAYDAGAAILTAPPMGDPYAGVAPVVLAVAVHFQSQHRDHANALKASVVAGGGTPVDEATVMFTPPSTFTAGVLNVIKLAANAEKAASVGYANTLKTMSSPTSAQLVAAIGGNETQHYVVLSLVAKGEVAPGAMPTVAEIVPRSFVFAAAANTTGLETVDDFMFA